MSKQHSPGPEKRDDELRRNDASAQKLDDESISALIAFFRLLDKWDREARRHGRRSGDAEEM